MTVGAVLTLAVIMQITGRTRWGETSEPEPAPEQTRLCPTPYRCAAEINDGAP